MKIEAIITDFDGTLVDTFEANCKAYQFAFAKVGILLSSEDYIKCFGLRFDDFMRAMYVPEEYWDKIKELKKDNYPLFFDYLILNKPLYEMIKNLHNKGIRTAIASTASKTNIMNAINALNIREVFDYIITGEDVNKGKPDPEVYNIAMQKLNVKPENVLIFEDSEVGVQAAEASNANWIKV